jgi:RNA polymerase sigma-70 factor (ECF subfamily)
MPSHAELELEMIDIPEEETVRLAQEGNAAAFEQLYRQYRGRVFALCLRMVKNAGEAEDLTQDAFLMLFRKIQTFRGESRFSTWLHRLVFNTVLMRLRKKRYPEVSLEETIESDEEDPRPLIELGGPDLRLSGVLDHMNLSRAIEQLPEGYRQMFVLHDIHGYEHHEIAKILGCTTGNCKSQLHKARVRIRELLQEALRSRAREKRLSIARLPVPQNQGRRLQCAKA